MAGSTDSAMALQVLVVDSDRDALAVMAASLEASGFAPTLADDFEAATAQLRTGSFPFLITAERLGAHNGLHLVLRAKANRAADRRRRDHDQGRPGPRSRSRHVRRRLRHRPLGPSRPT